MPHALCCVPPRASESSTPLPPAPPSLRTRRSREAAQPGTSAVPRQSFHLLGLQVVHTSNFGLLAARSENLVIEKCSSEINGGQSPWSVLAAAWF
eukprot:5391871-Pleurochrysis_carterae.AAC.3